MDKQAGSSSRTAKELGGTDKGPRGPRDSERISARIPLGTNLGDHTLSVQTRLIEQEVKELQMKGAVLELSSPQEGGFYSTLFLVPKKDGGQRSAANARMTVRHQYGS